MLIHLPIIENRIAQFAARFERHGKGWAYHGDRHTGGLPVSDAEHADLLAANARLLRRSERIMMVWLPIAVILCVAWRFHVGAMDDRETPWTFAPILLLPLPWVFRLWWEADHLAVELAGRRVPVTPPRPQGRAILSRLAALPPGIGVMLVLISGLLAVQSRPWATGEQRLWLGEAGLGLIAGLALLWIRRRRSRS